MEVIVENSYEEMSARTADMIVSSIRKNPQALLCLAAGDTPRVAYTLVAERVAEEKIDLSRCKFVSLDEWVGIGADNPGSCRYFLRTTLFNPLGLSDNQLHLFNSLAPDLDKECRDMDGFIQTNNGIDLIVVGIGRNGHIGFNEPGVATNLHSHVVELDNTTKTVGQKYFNETTALTQGITLGLKHLLEAKQAILIANGKVKAEVIAQSVEGPVDISMPASIMQQHSNGFVILDKEAASGLKKRSAGQL